MALIASISSGASSQVVSRPRGVQTSWLQTGEPLGRFADESIRSLRANCSPTVMIPCALQCGLRQKPPDPADTAKIADIVNPTERVGRGAHCDRRRLAGSGKVTSFDQSTKAASKACAAS